MGRLEGLPPRESAADPDQRCEASRLEAARCGVAALSDPRDQAAAWRLLVDDAASRACPTRSQERDTPLILALLRKLDADPARVAALWSLRLASGAWGAATPRVLAQLRAWYPDLGALWGAEKAIEEG